MRLLVELVTSMYTQCQDFAALLVCCTLQYCRLNLMINSNVPWFVVIIWFLLDTPRIHNMVWNLDKAVQEKLPLISQPSKQFE